MATQRKRKGKGGLAKRGRNKAKCQSYKDRNVRVRNKIRRLQRHLDKFPNDLNARKSISQLK